MPVAPVTYTSFELQYHRGGCSDLKQGMFHSETVALATELAVMRDPPSEILIVDDDPEVLLAAELVLKKTFRSVVTSSDPAQIEQLLPQRAFDVILLDMNFSAGETSGREGIHWLQRARALAPESKVVLMTAYGGVEAAVNAMREGAADFVVKPWDNAKLVATVSAVSQLAKADREVAKLRRRERKSAGDSDQ